MKLEDIGFYTLSDERTKNVTNFFTSMPPMIRAEIIMTNECNLSCVYCRELRPEINVTISEDKIKSYIDILAHHNLKNIRFSGGEPTLHSLTLKDIVKYSRKKDIKRIAISTNGTQHIESYKNLIKCGVNDFSISLDSGCCAINTKMCGGYESVWEKASRNIEELSKITYVTVGIVLNEININDIKHILRYIINLNPSDIRVIPSAQYNKFNLSQDLKRELLEMSKNFPILNYRMKQFISKVKTVRGKNDVDFLACPLVLDDIAIAGSYHFPCIIYLREGGYPIGRMTSNFREERIEWFKENMYYDNKICRENCIDVCIAYNNKAMNNYLSIKR